jgi:hypothetical protein
MTLESTKKITDVTEATGEAAAAMCILEGTVLSGLTTAGFDMEWGMHVHSGTGLDQIWSRTQNGGLKQYLIVEAKGAGARASSGATGGPPPTIYQMSTHWIIHNLQIMRRSNQQIAVDILNDLKLNIIKRWPAYGGAAKSYYGVNPANPTSGQTTAELWGAIITANWLSDGMLSYSVSSCKQYKNLTK